MRMGRRARIGALLAIGFVAATAASCGRGARGTTIAFVPKAMDSEFWLAMADGAREAASHNTNVALSIVAPDREVNIDQQVSILEDQIQRGVAAIVVAPAGSAQV